MNIIFTKESHLGWEKDISLKKFSPKIAILVFKLLVKKCRWGFNFLKKIIDNLTKKCQAHFLNTNFYYDIIFFIITILYNYISNVIISVELKMMKPNGANIGPNIIMRSGMHGKPILLNKLLATFFTHMFSIIVMDFSVSS